MDKITIKTFIGHIKVPLYFQELIKPEPLKKTYKFSRRFNKEEMLEIKELLDKKIDIRQDDMT